MSIHLAAAKEDIADVVLLPGDPLRAKFIAKNFLENAVCYNEVRGMYGFTGTYQGKRVSVQGTGMGVPSISIYVHELLESYGVKTLIRVGTCGALRKDVRLRDVILAMSASTDSATNRIRFPEVQFAPTADFSLIMNAYLAAKEGVIDVRVGPIFTTDTFYSEAQSVVDHVASYGALAVEMETSALYTLAAKFGARALSVLTVSDHLVTGETTTAQERQETFRDMMQIALDAAIRE
ncbi:purine-nucleoside phosphorylase [Ferroacidibacillus organovorans]|uniref:Purine nucleoside phosphorylase DeoD-type n=1 Tax=Ferroacidibacillus organovorans TaxID=1765683 RepID=A0A1V4EVL4_9BACL|nr:purine-nucleoside phosphorylase [Ferroacidibacillus organovorans]OPG16880.1 purine-nucleoside phosphorylase [Ferroacidibacillus organovorans]